MPIPAALLYSIPALAKLGTGIYQGIKGSKLSNQERPTYQIPESVRQATGTAESLASQRRLPGQNITEQRIQSSQAATLGAASKLGPGAALAAISNAQRQTNLAEQNLSITAAQMQQQNQRYLQQQLMRQGQYEDKEFAYNIDAPYQADMAAGSAMKGAAMQNVIGSVEDIAGGIGAQMAQDKVDALGNTVTDYSATYRTAPVPQQDRLPYSETPVTQPVYQEGYMMETSPYNKKNINPFLYGFNPYKTNATNAIDMTNLNNQ